MPVPEKIVQIVDLLQLAQTRMAYLASPVRQAASLQAWNRMPRTWDGARICATRPEKFSSWSRSKRIFLGRK
jgi:hypothetical protein